MDLSSGRLFWPEQNSTGQPIGRPLLAPISCDVLVVGAGVTGAMAAWHLARRGVHVAVIDRRAPATGSTAASTGLLQYEIDKTLSELTKLVGRTHAERGYRASRRSLDDMQALAAALPQPCGLVPRTSLLLAQAEPDVDDLKQEAKLRRGIGLEAEYLNRDSLVSSYGITRPGAIRCEVAFEVDPLRLTHGLLSAAVGMGVELYSDVELLLPEAARHDNPLPTRNGPTIRCHHLVIATGYETPEQFREVHRLTQLHSTYALTTEPLPEPAWSGEALIWEYADSYIYARTTREGRIMIGGEDEPFANAAARDSLLPRKTRTLHKRLGELFPQWAEVPVSHAWAGTFAQTHDGLPYIGMHPSYPDTHFCLGYGGNGITFSLLAAQITAGSITGHPHPDADLFRLDR